jgi:hypothetical protein
VLRSRGIPSVEGVIPSRTVAMGTEFYFGRSGINLEGFGLHMWMAPAKWVAYGTAVNSITAPNDKNRGHE